MCELKDYVRVNAQKLPWKWMAPESLSEFKLSTESDVWAYGVTLWEIYSVGDAPYEGMQWNLEFASKLRSGFRLESPNHCPAEM